MSRSGVRGGRRCERSMCGGRLLLTGFRSIRNMMVSFFFSDGFFWCRASHVRSVWVHEIDPTRLDRISSCMRPFLTIFARIESSRSPLSNGKNTVANRGLQLEIWAFWVRSPNKHGASRSAGPKTQKYPGCKKLIWGTHMRHHSIDETHFLTQKKITLLMKRDSWLRKKITLLKKRHSWPRNK